MSDSWIQQYSAALDIRDAREQAHKPYIDAYTRLADKTAAANVSAPVATASPAPTSPDQPDLTTLRSDLATTQKARSALQTRVADLTASLAQLQAASKQSSAQITALTRQKADTERKLRDREDEVRAKSRLATDAQDEMVALQLQLNLAEQRREELEKENKELVERWMKRMGEEAENMNRRSRWE